MCRERYRSDGVCSIVKTSKICFIVIWFGKLPNYFEVWLKGAEKNSTIDFLLFTDQETEYTLPGNVRKYITTLEEIKHRIQGILLQKNYFPVVMTEYIKTDRVHYIGIIRK